LTQLKNIADSLDIGILIIHHTRKGSNNKEATGDWMDDTLGSKAINGTADQTITLKRGRGNRQGELKLTGRDIEEQELVLTFDADCSWTIAGDKKEIQESDTRQLIYDWLREHGTNGPSSIHKGLTKSGYTGSLSTIQNILIKMVNSGVLQNAAGVYLVSSTGTICKDSLNKPIEGVEAVEDKDLPMSLLPEILPEHKEIYDIALEYYLANGSSDQQAKQEAAKEVIDFIET
jgi:hypothetical protein